MAKKQDMMLFWNLRPIIVLLIALGLIAAALWQLEAQRAGISVQDTYAGATPVTYYMLPESAPAPLVVIAHGFAGSRQLMEAYALGLARAGYPVASFDFSGHGRNPSPMTGDIDSLEGTTRILVDETLRIVAAGLDRPEADGRVAVLGHSMATDIIIRAAERDARIEAVIAISPFSQAVTPTHPENLLMITGQWEPGLRDFAVEALQMVDTAAQEGETAQSPDGEVKRRAVIAPNAEHVAVLFSRTGIGETIIWLNDTFGRSRLAEIPSRGLWIVALITGSVLLVWPLTALLPSRAPPDEILPGRLFAAALLLPMIAAPLAGMWVPAGLLPVLIADYLAVHMLLYGMIQLAVIRFRGLGVTGLALGAGLLLAAYGLLVPGLSIDRYLASFLPHAGRVPVILVLGLGAVPFMLADSAMAHANPQFWRRVLIRLAFLASLAIAVALDFERLFFLVLIIPVILLFFLVFGLMGRWVEARAGPLASGLGLGLLLAWSLGVTFPMIA